MMWLSVSGRYDIASTPTAARKGNTASNRFGDDETVKDIGNDYMFVIGDDCLRQAAKARAGSYPFQPLLEGAEAENRALRLAGDLVG
jgi:hypothetical protein